MTIPMTIPKKEFQIIIVLLQFRSTPSCSPMCIFSSLNSTSSSPHCTLLLSRDGEAGAASFLFKSLVVHLEPLRCTGYIPCGDDVRHVASTPTSITSAFLVPDCSLLSALRDGVCGVSFSFGADLPADHVDALCPPRTTLTLRPPPWC